MLGGLVMIIPMIALFAVLRYWRGGVRALDGLDLDVAGGEFVVLVGPSGCGKTTALRMVAGLELITGGTGGLLAEQAWNGVARLDARLAPRGGERVTFTVDISRLLFFDLDTGLAIRWRPRIADWCR